VITLIQEEVEASLDSKLASMARRDRDTQRIDSTNS
jgi:hypothetical protein